MLFPLKYNYLFECEHQKLNRHHKRYATLNNKRCIFHRRQLNIAVNYIINYDTHESATK